MEKEYHYYLSNVIVVNSEEDFSEISESYFGFKQSEKEEKLKKLAKEELIRMIENDEIEIVLDDIFVDGR